MNFWIALLCLFLSACGAMRDDFGDKGFKNAVAFGDVWEFNALSPEVEKGLYLRRYRTPIYEDGCFVGSHGACWYRYFLSVASLDEYPETAVFALENVGEVISAEWLAVDAADIARVRLLFNRYSALALENNPALVNKARAVVVTVTPQSITEGCLQDVSTSWSHGCE